MKLSRTTWLNGFFEGLGTSLLLLFLVPAIVHADLIISEIYYDAPGADGGAEYVELFNTGTASFDMKNFKINDGSNHALNTPPKNGGIGSLIIAPHAYAIVTSDAPGFLSKFSNVSTVIDSSLSLNNTGGTIQLRNASNTIVVSASYSSSIGASGDGNSLQIVSGSFVTGPPTPGRENASGAPKVVVAKVVKTEAPKQATKKTKVTHARTPRSSASRRNIAAVIEPIDNTITIDQIDATTTASSDDATSTSPYRAVGFPPTSLWFIGTSLLGITSAGLAFWIRREKSQEWEIEEITDDV